MYLIDCRACRVRFPNDARICPHCGHLRNHIAAEPNSNWERIWPVAESGESRWGTEKSS